MDFTSDGFSAKLCFNAVTIGVNRSIRIVRFFGHRDVMCSIFNPAYNDFMNTNERDELPAPAKRGGFFRRLRKWLIYLAIFYVMFVGLLAVNENYLVYPGSNASRGNWEPDFSFEEIEFQSADGTNLVGWYMPQKGATEYVLLCHGNAENVAQSAQHSGLKFQAALNANVFVFDYRGYGKSEGSPNEKGVLADAEAALDWLNQRTGTTPSEIILAGHSIGGGPAVHLAAKFGGKALYLQRTFASIVEPAQSKYWFVPVSLIMQNRYESAKKIMDCDVPLHQSHGDLDSLVPIESGRKVFANSAATHKEFYVNKGKGHWHRLPLAYWQSVRDFLNVINGEAVAQDSGGPMPEGTE